MRYADYAGFSVPSQFREKMDRKFNVKPFPVSHETGYNEFSRRGVSPKVFGNVPGQRITGR